MRILLLLLLSFGLTSCDGFDIDSVDDSSTDDTNFTTTELAYNAVFSSSLLTSTTTANRDGFIVLFNNSAELDEIQLSPTSDDALIGTYDWTISNDELQVTYADGEICTSNKTDETTLQYTATSSCDSTPDNDPITGTLLKPISFDEDDLSAGYSVDIDNSGNDEGDRRINFFSNGIVEISDHDSDGEPDTSTIVTGTYTDSNFTNIIKVEYAATDEHSLFVLLNGSLSSGTMLELRYTESTTDENFSKIFIYSINDEDEWEAESFYDDISID